MASKFPSAKRALFLAPKLRWYSIASIITVGSYDKKFKVQIDNENRHNRQVNGGKRLNAESIDIYVY